MHYDEARERIFLQLIAAAVLFFSLVIAIQYMDQPLLERHGFRQTQTALSVFWTLQEGWRFDYETPVAGYPWSIPFEFPFYQAAIVLIVKLTNWPIDAVGRMLSYLALLACAYPAHLVVKRLGLPRRTFWVFCILLWSSPIYLYWGRTFMLETTALFFAFAMIPFALDFHYPRIPFWSILLCTLFGTLACLQKATTGGPVIMVAGLVWLTYWFFQSETRLPPLRNLIMGMLAFGLPILIALLWTHHADIVKQSNALGAQLTSSALRDWNFGDLSQRISTPLYAEVFLRRMLFANAGGLLGFALLLGGLLYSGERLTRLLVFVSLALFATPILIFSNLHIVHDYYQSGCALFLIAALTISVAIWLPRYIPGSYVVPLLTALLVASNLHAYRNGYYGSVKRQFDPEQERALAVGQTVRSRTAPGEAILVFGNSWNSDVAYYAERKSFTVPESFQDYDEIWQNPRKYLGSMPLGAIVVCPTPKGPDVERFTEDNGWDNVKAADCVVLLRHHRSFEILEQ